MVSTVVRLQVELVIGMVRTLIKPDICTMVVTSGGFYSHITTALGFRKHSEEGKTMGLGGGLG